MKYGPLTKIYDAGQHGGSWASEAPFADGVYLKPEISVPLLLKLIFSQ
jgi:hypothetical protein